MSRTRMIAARAVLPLLLTTLPGSARTSYAAEQAGSAIFSRPVISRAYEQGFWTLRNVDGSGLRETPDAVGAAIARLHPSYVSGLIYLENGTEVTGAMIADFDRIRSLVRATNPAARFDIEISLNRTATDGDPFTTAASVVAKLQQVDALLHPDGWWFDFYDVAPPDWVAAATAYAHAHGQTVGGNVFNSTVPAHADAVAFVDDPAPASPFGFDFNPSAAARLRANSPNSVILGHLQSNAQNETDGHTTESCTYIRKWSFDERTLYNLYWAYSQSVLHFTYLVPVFYPLCPGAYAFDPLRDSAGGVTFLDVVRLIAASEGSTPRDTGRAE